LVSLGGFILFFGFLAFNGGSQGSISSDGDAAVVALAIVNTILSGTYVWSACHLRRNDVEIP
jgi:Amt family ammonium transporter